jgi:hypothetical protein
MDDERLLTWEDVEPAAKEAFNVLIDQPELYWAREAWGHVACSAPGWRPTAPS